MTRLRALDVVRLARTVERFDPAQPRDPHTGEWIDDPSAIFRKVLKFGGNKVAVTAHDDGSRTLSFDDRSVRLTSRELTAHGRSLARGRSLRSLALAATGWDVGKGDGIGRVSETPDGRPRTDLVLGVKKVGKPPDVHPSGDEDEDTWDLTPVSIHLPPNDDPSYDEMMDSPPVVTMRQRDLLNLAEQADQLIADRVDTGSGRLDMWRDGGRFVLKPEGGEELQFNRKSARALDRALEDLWDEEFRDSRPATETAEKTVATNLGDVTVRMTGEGVRTEIVTPGGTITVDEAHLLGVALALGELSGRAYESTRPGARDVIRIAEAGDVDPGEQLHHYWTKGEGLKRWVGSPHPWTTLNRLLRKHVGSERAKRMAAEWVHEVTGLWPGSDAHRVAHGKPPRGDVIGPG